MSRIRRGSRKLGKHTGSEPTDLTTNQVSVSNCRGVDHSLFPFRLAGEGGGKASSVDIEGASFSIFWLITPESVSNLNICVR